MKEKDREEIRQLIREELKEALVRTVTVEYGPRKQGDPEKVIKEETWNVLDWFVTYLPRIEAALRGMQADIDKTKNRVLEQQEMIKVVGNTLLAMESSAKKIAMLSDVADAKMIEAVNESNPQ